MNWHQSLPFSDFSFFLFGGIAIAFILVLKAIGKKSLFPFATTVISLTYLGFLYPKPLHFIGVVIYLYVSLQLLLRFYRKSNIVFPMFLLALPMVCMKITNILPYPEGGLVTGAFLFQIAGLSYLSFRVMGLYVDERRKNRLTPPLDFFNFCAFVPTLLIGPIDRFANFQSESNKAIDQITIANTIQAIEFLLQGLVYKFIIAHFLFSALLEPLINNGSILYHLQYMYIYLVYLFFDFAGYSLLAMAFGKFMGFSVPVNFNLPFLSQNPKEFWTRWHKSLGDWLGDYFFKPIFKDLTSKKRFKSIQRQNLALFATFGIMGFWNGFELHFILSGFIFGLYSVIHNYYIYRCKKAKRDVLFGNLSPLFIKGVSIFLMFNATAFAIYIFSGNLI
ncbi:MAG: membrane protein involved in D-alanine export [Sphingobacteriales bacterium]|jgi:membrane protein involved in D-alanine export